MNESSIKQDTYAERDLRTIAYLMSTGLVKIEGTRAEEGGIIYVLFSPYETASKLVSGYINETADPIQPKKLLACFDQARTMVFRAKEEAGFSKNSYGGNNYDRKNYR